MFFFPPSSIDNQQEHNSAEHLIISAPPAMSSQSHQSTDLLLAMNPQLDPSLLNSSIFGAHMNIAPDSQDFAVPRQHAINLSQQLPQSTNNAPQFQMPPPSNPNVHSFPNSHHNKPEQEHSQVTLDAPENTVHSGASNNTQIQFTLPSVDDISSIPAGIATTTFPGSSPDTPRTAAATASSPSHEAHRNRNWRIIRYNHHPNFDDALRVEINLSIRGEDAKCYVPDRLYCSHRYKLQHKIVAQSSLTEDVPLLLSILHVVDPNTMDEILSKKTGKGIVKGDAEALCTVNEQGFTCKMRIQFTESCYKYNRQDFLLMIHYCDPKNKEDPLFSVISPPLKIYARKPSTPISTLTKEYKPNRKRKRKDAAMIPPARSTTIKRMQQMKGTSSTAKDLPRKKSRRTVHVEDEDSNDKQWITGEVATTTTTSNRSESGDEFTAPPVPVRPSESPPIMVQFTNKLQYLLQLQRDMSGEYQHRIQEYVLNKLLTEAEELEEKESNALCS